jgi:hypothetical protein
VAAPGPELADDAVASDGSTADSGDAEGLVLGSGPYDAGDEYPQIPRVDLGALQVPVTPDYEIQLVFAEQQGAWVNIGHQGSELQLQAFAAPRREDIWDDVRTEIIGEIAGAGGRCEEREGPFGPELLAHVPAQPGQPQAGLMPVRFIGIDGPRWFLRGLFRGPATTDPQRSAPLEALVREVVVVRGDAPMPPRDLLELRLPAEAQQALAEQQAKAAEEQKQQYPFNPFERGPEITETR